jgi:hypothetical protein
MQIMPPKLWRHEIEILQGQPMADKLPAMVAYEIVPCTSPFFHFQ